jgi:flagellin
VEGISVGYYSDEVPVAKYSLSVTQPLPRDAEGNIDLQEGDVTLLQDGSENAFPADAKIAYSGDKVTVTASGEFEINFYMSDAYDAAGTSDITLDLTGMGAMRVQIGANEGQVLAIRIPEVSLRTLNIEDIDISTEAGAQEAIELSKQANAFISSVRARIGAYENRLEHTESSIDITEENMTSAFSRLMDTDMAEEMTEYTNQQVLNQAGISILTQANQRPSEMLQLLQ